VRFVFEIKSVNFGFGFDVFELVGDFIGHAWILAKML
jgi:hypothetical protein